ncbi:MAG: TIGR04283 family arsenosugar biosynthesis glycosyltransferase, partial [Rhodothermales bacterium]
VVCDGGSTDETIDIARCRARIVSTSSGRAHQMNTGAHNATGEILVFLHADTALPDGGLESIREAFKSPRVAGGCFRLCFDEENVLLRFYSWGTSVIKWSRLVFGDRTIFVRRSVFEQVGGFPDQPLFEDMEFFRAVRKTGPVAYLSPGVVTSSRRFSQHGYFRQQLRNLGLWLLYLLGVPAGRLQRFYPNASDLQMRKQRPT